MFDVNVKIVAILRIVHVQLFICASIWVPLYIGYHGAYHTHLIIIIIIREKIRPNISNTMGNK